MFLNTFADLFYRVKYVFLVESNAKTTHIFKKYKWRRNGWIIFQSLIVL